MEIIRFKITIYLGFNGNEHFAGKSSMCFLVYRYKVRHPSTPKLTTQVWKKATFKLTSHHRYINDLQQQIIEAIDTVTVDMLAKTWQKIEYWFDIVRVTDGAHIEVYQSI